MADEEKDERTQKEIAAEEEMRKYAQEEQGEGEKQEQVEVEEAKFQEFSGSSIQSDNQTSAAGKERIEMLMDIVLPVSIELGRTKMFIKNILELERGSIVEIDKLAGEPVDLLVNNKKMAEGEVVVVEKHFGIRITNLIDPKDRIKNLGN